MTKVIFFGTPDYVLPILRALKKHYKIVGVVTQEPKEVGRKHFITRSGVDNWAYKRKIPVIYNFDKSLPEASLGVVAAYGKIIPQAVIRQFKFGILNVHPSLLPKYRGASPVQAAILAGEPQTGVTVIKIDDLLDHGPIISQFKEEILLDDTTDSLRERLFSRSAQFLVELLPYYLKGRVKPKEQEHQKATFTKIINKEDGYLNLKKAGPEEAERFIKAMHPWPGAWTFVTIGTKKLRLKLFPEGQVQLEGKTKVTQREFERGYGPLTSLLF